MQKKTSSMVSLLLLVVVLVCSKGEVREQTPCQLAAAQGYICQDYWATTADGFGINIQRIANQSGFSDALTPVVLQHGTISLFKIFVLL